MAVGLFAFWRRTRFRLPKYVHVIAAIAFIFSLWLFSIQPAMIWFFFFYDGLYASNPKSEIRNPK